MRIPSPLHGLTTLILLSTIITPFAAIPVSSNTLETPTLQKRNPPFSLHNLYLQRTSQVTMLIPAAPAASLLADFYSEIHARCITYWMPTLAPPQADLILEWGAFQLRFVARDGSSEGISWEFVRDWSALMFRLSTRGYTGLYDQGWWNAAGTLGLYIGLRIVDGVVDRAVDGRVKGSGNSYFPPSSRLFNPDNPSTPLPQPDRKPTPPTPSTLSSPLLPKNINTPAAPA
ncbi:hypothetical protein BDR22DRAFT_822204 [Usnea florida]